MTFQIPNREPIEGACQFNWYTVDVEWRTGALVYDPDSKMLDLLWFSHFRAQFCLN